MRSKIYFGFSTAKESNEISAKNVFSLQIGTDVFLNNSAPKSSKSGLELPLVCISAHKKNSHQWISHFANFYRKTKKAEVGKLRFFLKKRPKIFSKVRLMVHIVKLTRPAICFVFSASFVIVVYMSRFKGGAIYLLYFWLVNLIIMSVNSALHIL